MNIRVTPIPNAEPGADILRDGTAEIPEYLERVYWWTYVRPWAVRFFERQWLVNAILLGNYVRLRTRRSSSWARVSPEGHFRSLASTAT